MSLEELNNKEIELCNQFFDNIQSNDTEIHYEENDVEKVKSPEGKGFLEVPPINESDKNYPFVDMKYARLGINKKTGNPTYKQYKAYNDLAAKCGDPLRPTYHRREDQFISNFNYPDVCWQFLRYPYRDPVSGSKFIPPATKVKTNKSLVVDKKGMTAKEKSDLSRAELFGIVIGKGGKPERVKNTTKPTELASYKKWENICGDPFVEFYYNDSEYQNLRTDFINSYKAGSNPTVVDPRTHREVKEITNNNKINTNYNNLINEFGDPTENDNEVPLSNECRKFLSAGEPFTSKAVKRTSKLFGKKVIIGPEGKEMKVEGPTYNRLVKKCGAEPGTTEAEDKLSKRVDRTNLSKRTNLSRGRSRSKTRTNLSDKQICDALTNGKRTRGTDKKGKRVEKVNNPLTDNEITVDGTAYKNLLRDYNCPGAVQVGGNKNASNEEICTALLARANSEGKVLNVTTGKRVVKDSSHYKTLLRKYGCGGNTRKSVGRGRSVPIRGRSAPTRGSNVGKSTGKSAPTRQRSKSPSSKLTTKERDSITKSASRFVGTGKKINPETKAEGILDDLELTKGTTKYTEGEKLFVDTYNNKSMTKTNRPRSSSPTQRGKSTKVQTGSSVIPKPRKQSVFTTKKERDLLDEIQKVRDANEDLEDEDVIEAVADDNKFTEGSDEYEALRDLV